MISITKYLKDESRDAEATLRRTVAILLQLIELHAVEGDSVDYAQFRSGIHHIAGRFSEDTPHDEILIIVGEVARSLKDYAERTSRFVKAQSSEYQRMVNMLTETIAATVRGSDRSVQRLRDVERKLERASVIEDVRVLRMQLAECLGSIRQEIQTQHAAAADSAARLAAATNSPGPQTAPAYPETDRVTGLPGRPAAESALQTACMEEGHCWVAVVVAHRLSAINARFGSAVGDRILRRICAQLRGGLSAEDLIFRWSGPAFISVLRRATSESQIRSELARITSGSIEEVVEIGNRSILLPVSSTWTLFPLSEPARVISQKADQFVASYIPAAPAAT